MNCGKVETVQLIRYNYSFAKKTVLSNFHDFKACFNSLKIFESSCEIFDSSVRSIVISTFLFTRATVSRIASDFLRPLCPYFEFLAKFITYCITSYT